MKNALRFSTPFELLFEDFWSNSTFEDNYPPYNIVKRSNTYIIELAVAGFSRNDINVQVDDGTLVISAEKAKTKDFNKDHEYDGLKYLHKAIATRSFVRKFTLSPDMKVTSSYVEDGILSVEIEKVIPEDRKPRQIPVQAR